MTGLSRRISSALCSLLAAACLLAPSPASAQAPEAVVTVLELDVFGVDATVADDLYDALRAEIALHPRLDLNDVPPQSQDEMLLAIGCEELTFECSQSISDILGSDFLAWGSLSPIGDAVLVQLVLWDLTEGNMAAEREQQLPPGAAGPEELRLTVRSLLFPPSAVVEIPGSAPGLRVQIDGEDVGETPLRLTGFSAGVYVVQVGDDPEQIARINTGVNLIQSAAPPSTVDERVAPAQADPTQATPAPPDSVPGPATTRREAPDAEVPATQPPDATERPDGPALGDLRLPGDPVVDDPQAEPARGTSIVAPAIVTGLGVAALATGAVFGAQMNATESDFDAAASAANPDLDRLADLESTGDGQALVANVLYGAGGAVAAVGLTWLIVKAARGGGGDEPNVTFAPSVAPNGARVDVHLSF